MPALALAACPDELEARILAEAPSAQTEGWKRCAGRAWGLRTRARRSWLKTDQTHCPSARMHSVEPEEVLSLRRFPPRSCSGERGTWATRPHSVYPWRAPARRAPPLSSSCGGASSPLRGVCMQEHASRAPRTFYMQGWKPRSDFHPPIQSVLVCGERLEHSCLYQDV